MGRITSLIPVSKVKNSPELKQLLKNHGLGLTPSEAKKLCKILKRDPTLSELWVFNVEWSEHCSYKSSRSTLKKYLPTEAPHVVLGPSEDAGIVELCSVHGEKYCLVVAHESHNHPSQVLPVEGAGTGIGGIVRDVACMGAHVVGVADPLRFGKTDAAQSIAKGVVEGIWQYGNALGVPNLGGDAVFADTYNDNCLVNVVAAGVVKEKEIIRSRVPPEAAGELYDVILVGKPTDHTGFGGAAFASEILDESLEQRGAVQVPDPFLENVLIFHKANEDVFKMAQKEKAVIGFKDLGAGGIACAASEMGAAGGFGMEIDLSRVHVALPDLNPEVICCAETQERFLLAVPRRITKKALHIYNNAWELSHIYEGAAASVIGRVRKNKQFVILHREKPVVSAPIEAVTSCIQAKRLSKKKIRMEKEPDGPLPGDYEGVLLKMLASLNIASREPLYRFYDTEVQGNAVLRPGEADAAVIAPIAGHSVGVAISCDGNPFYGRISPYWGGAGAVAEAMRNVACVGAVPWCLTDCLNYGNPENPYVFYEFQEGVRGLSDAAKQLWLKDSEKIPVPFVSGNVSFYNESKSGSQIDPSPVICCFGILCEYSVAATLCLKEPGNVLLLAGERFDECGGSVYYQEIFHATGRNVPKVRWNLERGIIHGAIHVVQNGLALSAHDISNGGLLVTLCEMAMGGWGEGHLGAEIDLRDTRWQRAGRTDKTFFSESSGVLLEVKPENVNHVVQVFKNYCVKIYQVGRVTEKPFVSIRLSTSKALMQSPVSSLKKAWRQSNLMKTLYGDVADAL